MRKDWKEVRLKDITVLNPPCIEDIDDLVSFVPMENLRNGYINYSNVIQFQEAKGKYTSFSNGDILIAKVTPCFENGNIAIAEKLYNNKGFGSSEIFVLRTTHNSSKSFLFFYCQSNYFREKAISTMSGVAGLKRIPSLFMRTHSLLFPPLPTQHAIAHYLDEKLGIIDRQMALLEKKRDSYNVLRKSLINQVVRQGLPSAVEPVETKDSGIEWFGKIPKHWEVKRVKDVTEIFGRIGFRGYTVDDIVLEGEGAISLSPSNIIDNKLVLENYTSLSWDKYYESPEIMVFQNDVIFVKTASVGKVAIIDQYPIEMTLNPQLIVFKKIKINPKLFYYILNSSFVEYQIFGANNGGVVPTISQTKISNFLIPIPPLSEQRAIAEYLDTQSEKIDRIVENINAQLGKLAQLKKSLINECVTGEREV